MQQNMQQQKPQPAPLVLNDYLGIPNVGSSPGSSGQDTFTQCDAILPPAHTNRTLVLCL
jgi:hypothetical protein